MVRKIKNAVDVHAFLDKVEFHDAALLSYVTSSIIVPVYDEIKRDYGVTRPEYLLLLCLSQFRVLTAQDVSRLTGRPRNSISRAVNSMLKLEYIKRAPDPDDGRQARLKITPAGRKLQKKIAATMTRKQEEVLSVLSTTERKTLGKLLRKAAAHASSLG